MNTRFDVLAVVLLKFQLLRYVMLRCWVSVACCFEDNCATTECSSDIVSDPRRLESPFSMFLPLMMMMMVMDIVFVITTN